MLDEQIFKARLIEQCRYKPISILAGWQLAENVFLSAVKFQDDKNRTFIFYYDKREIKRRSLSAMNEHAQKVFDIKGSTTGTVSEDKGDTVYIFYLLGNSLGSPYLIENEDIALYLAAEIFTQSNGCQVRWYDKPLPVKLNLSELCT
jgi:hypothetical protein